ncbi:MAG: hypothetical protein GPJ54_01990 [Candidatus Heimdallarchaeota archaeon]|nr:hypothetical protein [Candidatus Heimdallarchaeota archaeon]
MGSQFKVNLNKKAEKYQYDYTIPQVSVEQLEGILKVVDLMNERLGIDKMIIRTIFFQFMIEEQVKLERYHLSMESNIASTRFATKKNLEYKFKEVFSEILEDKSDMNTISQTLDQMFEWYLKKYLKDK